MKKRLSPALLGLFIGIFLTLGLYGAWAGFVSNFEVSSGQPLTDDLWNDLMADLDSLQFTCVNVTDACTGCKDISVNCDSGYTAAGGGCYFKEFQNHNMDSAPTSNGWECIGDDKTELRAYVRCCKFD